MIFSSLSVKRSEYYNVGLKSASFLDEFSSRFENIPSTKWESNSVVWGNVMGKRGLEKDLIRGAFLGPPNCPPQQNFRGKS